MSDGQFNPLQLLESRFPFPGQQEFYQMVDDDYENFINSFDLSWFDSLTSRDAMVSYAIILGQLAKKLDKEEKIASFDDFLLWARLGVGYAFSEYTLRYLLRKKMYIYLVVRPVRLLINPSKRGKQTRYSPRISGEHRDTLVKFQYSYYLLEHLADLAEIGGYQVALKFLKSFSRISQSLEASLYGKLKKTPDVFMEQLVSLVGKPKEVKLNIEQTVIKIIGEYVNFGQKGVDTRYARDYLLSDDLEILPLDMKDILYHIHEHIHLEIDPSFDFRALNTMGDVISYFENRTRNLPLPEHLQNFQPEGNSLMDRIKRVIGLDRPMTLIRDAIDLPKTGIRIENHLSAIKWHSDYYYYRYPKKADQIHFLALNQQPLPSLFTNKYAEKSKSLHHTRNRHYVIFDNTSFILNLLFTRIITDWVSRKKTIPSDTYYSRFSGKEQDFLEYLDTMGFDSETISSIQSTKRDPDKKFAKRIINKMKTFFYTHRNLGYNQLVYGSWYFPNDIIERFLIFIYLEIVEEIQLLESMGAIKMYPNDWVVIYYSLLRKWNIIAKGGSTDKLNIKDMTLLSSLITRDDYIQISNKQCPSCGGMTMIMSSFCENCGNAM